MYISISQALTTTNNFEVVEEKCSNNKQTYLLCSYENVYQGEEVSSIKTKMKNRQIISIFEDELLF